MANDFYPLSPRDVSVSITAPSANYTKKVKSVMFTIILFFVVYMIMIILSIALSVLCVYLGIGILSISSHWIGLLAGLGVISIGLLVFFFLVKFIFSVKKFDESRTVKITEKEQPVLFSFIKDLTRDTQTAFPKKIVLSADVNACVYYNDSFWSMFFPVRKNLQIGLGLVNAVTISEFKAVMAHEFGHFSQKSMKLGSFVYNVNKVIYNMLYDNKSYSNFLSGFGSMHAVIYMFVWITVQIVNGIQLILQRMYALINKSYMGLSREMEFHADAVAASVSGSNNCISAFKKIEISDVCFDTVFKKADVFLKENKVLANLYAGHNIAMRQYAKDYNLPMVNNAPMATDEFLKQSQLSKINIENQWASHPSMKDRILKLQETSIWATPDDRPAWLLFDNVNELQQKLTAVVYQHLPQEQKNGGIVEENVFEASYIKEAEDYSLPACYNGYYDDSQVEAFDIVSISVQATTLPVSWQSFHQLYSHEKVAVKKSMKALQSDASIVEAICKKQIDVTNFDFDGQKYKTDDATMVLEKINQLIEETKTTMRQQEEQQFSFFYSVAKSISEEEVEALKNKYACHLKNDRNTKAVVDIFNKEQDLLSPMMRGQSVSIDAANVMADSLREETRKLKLYLKEMLEAGIFNDAKKQEIQQFLYASYQYFSRESFFDEELRSLHKTAVEAAEAAISFQFRQFKKLLEYQVAIMEKACGKSANN